MSDHSHSHHHGAGSHHGEVDRYDIDPAQWATGRNTLMLIALLSVVACAAGYFMDAPRFFHSYVVAFAFTSFIGVGAFFYVMVQFLTGSVWSVTMRRIMENIMMTIPVGIILFIPIALGLKEIYPWTNAAFMASDAALKSKAGYLTETFFLTRGFGYFVFWSIWAFMIYRASTNMDNDRNIKWQHRASAWSAPGLFFAVVVGSLAAFDWLMSLDPKWYSTMFGLQTLAGGALSFIAVVTLISLQFRNMGILKNSITDEHYHDLGKWLLALTAFYTYLAFSQYMLIWYANLPEETIWYRHRLEGSWFYIGIAMPFLRFLIPFSIMLCRGAKRSKFLVALIAVWSLVVEYIDLYWIAMPTWYKDGFHFHWLDLATLAATVSICGLMFWSLLRRHKIAPVGDLRFEQSMHFENA